MTIFKIDKLYKKPDLLFGAKHYRMEWIGNALYVIEMSEALPIIQLMRNSLNGFLTYKLLNFFEAKFAGKNAESLNELDKVGHERFLNRRICFSILNISKSHINVDSEGEYCLVPFLGKSIRLYANSSLVQDELVTLSKQINI